MIDFGWRSCFRFSGRRHCRKTGSKRAQLPPSSPLARAVHYICNDLSVMLVPITVAYGHSGRRAGALLSAKNPILAKLDIPRDPRGRVEEDPALRVRGCEGVWALGDCVAVPDAASGHPCPPTAQYAIRQGRRLVENIAAVLRHKAPKPFDYKPLGILAGLGRRSAVAEILGLKFSGFLPGGYGGRFTSSSCRDLSGRSEWRSTGHSTSSFPATLSTCGRCIRVQVSKRSPRTTFFMTQPGWVEGP